jgi:hypothetical protein
LAPYATGHQLPLGIFLQTGHSTWAFLYTGHSIGATIISHLNFGYLSSE